ncbi:Nucleotid_trans domain-containing protein [Caenorhabditis elegans]|uniref:Nucleotid_trans domain-containing protein n=1 Tax=Caenorhabditis elegans TaxID=6239 RepID=Q9N4X7_CAEEL|nr:Nucleotid_trans domain-containing protein [Caenorhabditis elegans]CCD62296.1 Nucleotid_trans domain-containing protein [Caenorhabditis elegans]|eukprot:NP_503702.1 Uncharacterized protein CELE_Y45G12C.1 [Caenorhabditis elegans]
MMITKRMIKITFLINDTMKAKTVLSYATFSFIALLLFCYKTNKTTYIKNPKFKILEASTPALPIDKECECISSWTGKSYDFCYRNPKNATLVGKRFNCTWLSTLEDLKLVGLHEQSLVDLYEYEKNDSDVIFVSATSRDHLANFNSMYAIVKHHWPRQKLILYSLDLTDKDILDIEKEPNVKVRKFDYSKYPKYVKNLMEYRFKALILAEAIRDFQNVWWIDAHTKWFHPKPLDTIYENLAECVNDAACEKKSSIQMFINSTHSNYAVLNRGLLDYFPTFDIDDLKSNEKSLQLSAMLVYLARTQFTLDILKWHTLCALEEKCMKPPGAKLKCDTIPEWNHYAGCFRYDQSSINILLFNHFRDHNHYFMNPGTVLRTY